MHKIKCKDCDCVYVGRTSQSLKTRLKEHAKAIATLDKIFLLAKHHMLHNYQIDLESFTIVEARHSVRHRKAINERIALPNIYNNIKNFYSH